MPYEDMFGGVPTQQLNPYDAETQRQQGLQASNLANQHQQSLINEKAAQLPGLQAESQKQQLSAQEAQALQSGKIRNAQQSQDNAYSTGQGAQLGIIGQKLSQAGAVLGSIPSVNTPAGNSRMIALKQMADQEGIPMDHPLMKHLMQSDPATLDKTMGDLGSRLAQTSADFIQKRAIEQDKTNALIENNKATNSSRETVAQIAADSRVKAAELKAQQAIQHANIEQKISSLTSDPNWRSDPAKVEQYSTLMKSATVLRNAAGNGYLNADMTDTANPSARADAVISDVTKPKQSTPQSSPSQYTPGQVYQHSDGSAWKYNGGDVKDIKNWTKVK